MNTLMSFVVCVGLSIHICTRSSKYAQLDWTPSRNTKNNLPTNRKGYDNSEPTVGKLLARRIQLFFDYFCKINVDLFFFKITVQKMAREKQSKQNWIRLVKYSSAEVSDVSEAPRFVGKLIF